MAPAETVSKCFLVAFSSYTSKKITSHKIGTKTQVVKTGSIPLNNPISSAL